MARRIHENADTLGGRFVAVLVAVICAGLLLYIWSVLQPADGIGAGKRGAGTGPHPVMEDGRDPGAASSHAPAWEVVDHIASSLADGPAMGLDAASSLSERSAWWLSLPRTRFELGWYVARMFETQEARVLVRNVNLNPEDMEIPPEQVAHLDHVLSSLIGPATASLNRTFRIAVAQDIGKDAERIAWRSVESQPRSIRRRSGEEITVEWMPLPTEGTQFIYRTKEGGGFVGVAQNDLPSVAAVKQARSFFICEVGCAVIGWFVGAGVLDGLRAEALRGEVFAAAEGSMR